MTRREADALIVFLHRRQRRYHAEALRMGVGPHTWVLLTDREGGTCPPPFVDPVAFLADARGCYDLAPECRRLLREWLRGQDQSVTACPRAVAAPPRVRFGAGEAGDAGSRLFSALLAAALRRHEQAAVCDARGERAAAERARSEAQSAARKGLRLLQRQRLRYGVTAAAAGAYAFGRQDGGLERTGAVPSPRRF